MNLNRFIKNNLLKIKVISNSSKLELIEEDGKLKLYLKSIPDKNKANLELIKFFKKEFGLRMEIKSGMRSREKVLKVI